ncbi:hypothetical protein L596_010052 [Steinernema carpocapsae]|uniref:Fork-head domain-containing protein n=1 Tax=Steinernema carpocapsae TaxID=34508 RepID=A0A4U5PIH5_STECR|nr:hypothetical protein L596_010052 [Steinernema carpocapsae]
MPLLSENAPVVARPESGHQQNRYGLSYPGMIVLAIHNSDCTVDSDFCNKALTVRDIYRFLTTHVKPFQDFDDKKMDKTERVIRHSLSQTGYFHRFSQMEDGTIRRVPSKTDKTEKGCLWGMYPQEGDNFEMAEKRIKKVFKHDHEVKFKANLVNPEVYEAMKKGYLGWRGPHGESLGKSEALGKYEKYVEVAARKQCQAYPAVPSPMEFYSMQPSSITSSQFTQSPQYGSSMPQNYTTSFVASPHVHYVPMYSQHASPLQYSSPVPYHPKPELQAYVTPQPVIQQGYHQYPNPQGYFQQPKPELSTAFSPLPMELEEEDLVDIESIDPSLKSLFNQ